MKVVKQEDFFINDVELCSRVQDGNLFIYPTDTIYGIGCDATNERAVLNIRNTKHQHERPLSVIAPSIEWITENCEITSEVKKWIGKLPGPYTLILKLKNKNSIAQSVTETNSVGVRIPDHPISKFVSKLGFPVITTSANISGKNFMTSIEDIDPDVKTRVDFIIDAGNIKGKPSDIIFLDDLEIKIKER